CNQSITFFFLMARRPPSSPLFPYTTLFRSWRVPGAPAARAQPARPCHPRTRRETYARALNPPAAAPHLRASLGFRRAPESDGGRSEEHTSELQSLAYLVCRLLLEKKKYSSLRFRPTINFESFFLSTTCTSRARVSSLAGSSTLNSFQSTISSMSHESTSYATTL